MHNDSPNAFRKSGSFPGKRGGAPITLLAAVFCLVFFFLFPRMLVRKLGMDSPWVSYLYLYGNGLIVFLIGLWIILRSGACKWGRGHDTFWFVVLLAGYVFFAVLHAAWTLAALYIPFRGGV